MAIYPTIKTGGGNIEMAVETALGTAGTYYDFRQCEDVDPTFPTDTREVLPVSHKGHRDPATREAQLSYETHGDGIQVATYAACSAITSADTDRPQFVRLLESMGCKLDASDGLNTTHVETYNSTTSWTLSADKGAEGSAMLVVLNDTAGTHWPCLTASYPGANAVVPGMALPAASLADKKVYRMNTVRPPKGEAVNAARSLAFKVSHYYPTSTETGSQFVYLGCAATEVDDVVFESGKPLKFGFKLHYADRAFDQSGYDLLAATYDDKVDIPIIDGAGEFRFGFADATNGATGGETATRTAGFRKATWKPGVTVIPVNETGTTTAINGLGGYLGVYTGSTIELVMDVEKDWWTRLESSGSQTAKYLELVQPSTASTKAALGLWMPQCFMTGKPVMDLWGDKEMTVTFTLEASSALYSTTDGKTDIGCMPWYFAISSSITAA